LDEEVGIFAARQCQIAHVVLRIQYTHF